MNKERLELFEIYIKSGINPILMIDIKSEVFDNSVVLKNNIGIEDLNGHYEGINFCPPSWYSQLLEKSKDNVVVLVIENINEIKLEDQRKFIEILKYKKVSTFELPRNCLIVVTANNIDKNKVNEEIYSLLAQV